MFKGSMVAIVTPLKNGNVDEQRLKELIEFQLENGTDAIVPCGTTGESATLSHDEHDKVIDITVNTVNKRVPVIAGTGSNSTAEAIKLTKHAKEIGEAMTNCLGKPIQVTIDIVKETIETPSSIKDQIQNQQQQEAEKIISDDSNIKALKEKFHATIVQTINSKNK